MKTTKPTVTQIKTPGRHSQRAPLTLLHEPAPPTTALTNDRLLGVFCYGAPRAMLDDPRMLHVPLERLDDGDGADVLMSTEPVSRGNQDGFAYACNADVLLAQLSLAPPVNGDVEVQAFDAYQRVRRFLEETGYPYPLRIWNYVDNINDGKGDAEVYKRFCLGRARGLQPTLDHEELLPAASAIGSHNNSGSLVIHLLAAKSPGVQIENPRQVSAFRYPRQYGIRSPSFSRARVVTWPDMAHLYLSGTASVVGHESLHQGDCEAQLHECLRNVDSLLETVSIPGKGAGTFSHQHLKQLRVYLRHREDLAITQACLRERLGSDVPVVSLLGDVCRHDLLIEIEGFYSCGLSST